MIDMLLQSTTLTYSEQEVVQAPPQHASHPHPSVRSQHWHKDPAVYRRWCECVRMCLRLCVEGGQYENEAWRPAGPALCVFVMLV